MGLIFALRFSLNHWVCTRTAIHASSMSAWRFGQSENGTHLDIRWPYKYLYREILCIVGLSSLAIRMQMHLLLFIYRYKFRRSPKCHLRLRDICITGFLQTNFYNKNH